MSSVIRSPGTSNGIPGGKMRELMLAGMNVARFNFSHGTHEEQRVKLERVRQVREELGLPFMV